MSEKEQFVPEKLWASLSEPEKEACIMFSVSDWASGVDQTYPEGMGIEKGVFEGLVTKGVIHQGTAQEFAKEWLAQHASQVATLDTKLKDYLHYTPLSTEEQQFSSTVRNKQSILQHESRGPRYRLAKKEFHEYLVKNFSD